MHSKIKLFLSVGFALALAGCNAGSGPAPVTLAPIPKTPPPPLQTFAPKEEGRHPLVILVPGCATDALSSRNPFYTRMAAKLAEQGYYAAVISYAGAGTGTSLCTQIATPKAMAETIARFAASLSASPHVDPTKIHLVGWSWGGTGVLEAIKTDSPKIEGLRSVAALYPTCQLSDEHWGSETTALLIVALNDTIASASECETYAKERSNGPAPMIIIKYERGVHGFDIPETLTDDGGVATNYDAGVAAASWQDLIKFLALLDPRTAASGS